MSRKFNLLQYIEHGPGSRHHRGGRPGAGPQLVQLAEEGLALLQTQDGRGGDHTLQTIPHVQEARAVRHGDPQ